MSWQHIVLIVWLSLEALAQIMTIGKERKPRTPPEAVVQICQLAVLLALAVTG